MFLTDCKNVKKPLHLKKTECSYFTQQEKPHFMQFERYYIEIPVILLENSRGYFTSKFRTDEIQVCSNEQRILNKSLAENIQI